MGGLSAPIPIFRSFDEAKMRSFYLDFLEFEVVFEHRFEPGFPLYIGVRKGDCVIHLSEHYGDATPGSSVRIQCPDLDDLCARLNAKKTNHARPGIMEQPWARDMGIKDPFGNLLIFYQDRA